MLCVIQVLMLLYVVYDLPANPLDPSYVPTKTPKHFHRMHSCRDPIDALVCFKQVPFWKRFLRRFFEPFRWVGMNTIL